MVCCCNSKDHPRLRGEKCRTVFEHCPSPGSPPLTRGKAPRPPVVGGSTGITPAYAGKRSFMQAFKQINEDHPRLRGEKLPAHRRCILRSGSPPLTRGKVTVPGKLLPKRRITPAYAGKSRLEITADQIYEDHPRLRGEKTAKRRRAGCRAGSPPLTRGKAVGTTYTFKPGRITPAYAGKSVLRRYCKRFQRDHPRLRGEKFQVELPTRPSRGITPAYAGKSTVVLLVQILHGDHPRLRGEKKAVKFFTLLYLGSPPLTRGKD